MRWMRFPKSREKSTTTYEDISVKALLSVSDKTNIVYFARELRNLGVEILSTGGTLSALKAENIAATDISAYTNSEELFGGRVKTLHLKIHGGILYRRDNASDAESARTHGISAIDIVCVNLYPFKETAERSADFNEIIENIDIGGPSLIRAAAKNYQSVLVVTESADYEIVIAALKNGENTLELREKMMIKAFELTARYDCHIANTMNARLRGGFGESHFIVGRKYRDTRYGENPHQKGALYEFDDFWSKNFTILKGESSFNNFADIQAAFRIVRAFGKNAVCIIKHNNPCGFALKDSALESYENALKCDTLSAYGGVVALNATLDSALATKLKETFFEAIVAPQITQDALEVFGDKKRVRLFTLKNSANDKLDFRHIMGGFLLQEQDFVSDEEVTNAAQMGIIAATDAQKRDLEIAYKLAFFTKSNCVAYVKDVALLGIGMGLTSRVDAARLAIAKAKDMGLNLRGAALASEAFFPFRDSVDVAAAEGISAIIEPGGSIRDKEVIEAANAHKIALYFSGKRHFLH